MLEEKSSNLKKVVERLRRDLGEGSFQILDYWEPDLCATGLAKPGDSRRYVYVSVFDGLAYDCDVVDPEDSERWETVASSEGATYEELREAVRQHLAGE